MPQDVEVLRVSKSIENKSKPQKVEFSRDRGKQVEGNLISYNVNRGCLKPPLKRTLIILIGSGTQT